MKDLKKIQEFFSKPLEENIDKVELPSTTTTKANAAITTAPTMAKVLLKMYNQIQDKEQSDFSKNPDFNIALKKLQGLANQVKENIAKAFDLQKGLNGMNYDVKVKHLNDFGKDVYEIYSQKSLDSDKIFFDAKKLGFPNVRVFDNMNEVEVGDKVKINKEYGGGKGEIEDKVGSFVIVNGKSYHESDVETIDLDEKLSARISMPKFVKDKNNPNFLNVYIKYDTGAGATMALGKETGSGQDRRNNAAEALRLANDVARDLEAEYNIEDIEITDQENGVVSIFAVSDDFVNMNPNMLGEGTPADDGIAAAGGGTPADQGKAAAKTGGLTTKAMNKILMKVIGDLDELKQLGEGMIEEELCAKGKAYRKKRMAAGEKSSAYLNGRAVKVCKGQMKG